MWIAGKNLSLYFHFPFCHHKCPYCHFFVLQDHPSQQQKFLEALKLEWKQKKNLFQTKDVYTLYFGGGTPSRSPLILKEVLSWFELLPQEITVEVNPEDLTEEKCIFLQSIGVNRLSIGVQSLIDTELRVLNRAHDAKNAFKRIQIAANFIPNISIDLMMELPDQTLNSFETSCQIAMQLPITHLSLYNLTIEPKTAFDRKKEHLIPRIAKEKESLAMLRRAVEIFESHGLNRYEISAFSKKGYESKHNLGYWTGRPFLGLGPSAYSYWNQSRFQNICNLVKYSQSLKHCEVLLEQTETLEKKARIAELLAIQLRILKGVNLKQFQLRHGDLFPELMKKITALTHQKLLILEKNILKLSVKGRLFYDTVAESIIQ